MNIAVLYFDGFCEFELVFSYLVFAKQSIFSISNKDKIFISEEGQKYVVDKQIKDVNTDDIDVLIITGGDLAYLLNEKEAVDFVKEVNREGKLIGGICGGAIFLAQIGILNGKFATGDGEGFNKNRPYANSLEGVKIKDEQVVVDGNLVTSQGIAYIEFALKLGEITGILKNKEQIEESIKWLRNRI